jgi:hypothetical protein
MPRFVVRAAFTLTTAAFIWSSDPIVGLLLAICALVWALLPMPVGPEAPSLPAHVRLRAE